MLLNAMFVRSTTQKEEAIPTTQTTAPLGDERLSHLHGTDKLIALLIELKGL